MSILFYSSGDKSGRVLKTIQQHLPNDVLEVWPAVSDKKAVSSAIVWQPPADFFDGLDNLQNVLSIAAGVDHLLQHPGLPPSANVIRLLDAGMAEPMAEYALYGVLHAQRCMNELAHAQANKEWVNLNAYKASEFKVGILGAGQLGARVAQRLVLNGYNVSCWSRSEKQLPNVKTVAGIDNLNGFLNDKQVLICLLPLTNETRQIINASTLSQLPDGAYFINPGRGAHVDEQALLNALNTNKLSGALLDVFCEEPLPAESPLWSHPNVIVTPHVAAPTPTLEAAIQIAQSLKLLSDGEKPPGLVNRQRGY